MNEALKLSQETEDVGASSPQFVNAKINCDRCFVDFYHAEYHMNAKIAFISEFQVLRAADTNFCELCTISFVSWLHPKSNGIKDDK